MQGKIFIDSNIFIYARVEQPGFQKHELARKFLKELEGEIIISIQVLNEFYNAMCKYKIADRTIQENINDILTDVNLDIITFDTIKLCWEIKTKYNQN